MASLVSLGSTDHHAKPVLSSGLAFSPDDVIVPFLFLLDPFHFHGLLIALGRQQWGEKILACDMRIVSLVSVQ